MSVSRYFPWWHDALRGNIPLARNPVCILLISLGWFGIFWLDFETLIKVLIKTLFDNLVFKVCKICACANHDYSLKHFICIFLIWYDVEVDKVCLWFHQLGRVILSKLYSVNCTVLLPNLLRPNFISIACVKTDTSSAELHAKRCFQEGSCDHIHNVI